MRRCVWFSVLLMAAGCGENGVEADPDMLPESALEFVVFDAAAPALEATEASFWAVAGDHRRVEIRYAPAPGSGEDGESFLKFDVPGDGLYLRPDGSPFAEGDSVLITVRVADDGRFLFEFSPAGLRFHPDHPAELDIEYRYAEIPPGDPGFAGRLSIWKQDRPGAAWRRLATVKFEEGKEVSAKVYGFSRFALASN